MMNIIQHPEEFKAGTRILTLTSRNKDESDGPTVNRVSYNTEDFDAQLASLAARATPNQRIYASGEPRDVKKAIRHFRRLQLESEYDEDPTAFYLNLPRRWEKSLMQPANAASKYWLVDCDTEEDVNVCREALRAVYEAEMLERSLSEPYAYRTKNGIHILIKPFNLRGTSDQFKDLVKKNPLMLWGY